MLAISGGLAGSVAAAPADGLTPAQWSRGFLSKQHPEPDSVREKALVYLSRTKSFFKLNDEAELDSPLLQCGSGDVRDARWQIEQQLAPTAPTLARAATLTLLGRCLLVLLFSISASMRAV